MAKLKRDNQKGFTIVELVVVIIILGILAATALPRFCAPRVGGQAPTRGPSLGQAWWIAPCCYWHWCSEGVVISGIHRPCIP